KRATDRARATAATSSRFLGVAVVVSESISRRATCATSSIASLNASSLAFDGALNPLSLRTNCSDAARISSSVAGGSKLNSVLILRHIFDVLRGLPRNLWSVQAFDDGERHVEAGRHARRRHDRVRDDPDAALNANRRVERRQQIERRPMGCGAPAAQQTVLRQQQRAGADRR